MQRIRRDGEIEEVVPNVSSINNKGKEWKNKAVEIIDSVRCFIPLEIEETMRALDHHFSGVEFSIFCVVKFDPHERKLFLQESYFIPEQMVSGAHVDYLEDAPEGFNCVIHKHPNGVMNFSGTDWTFINQNFDISLLWVNGKFHLGHVRTMTPFGRVKIDLTLEIEKRVLEVPQHFLSKIKRARFTDLTPRGKSYSQGFSGFGGFLNGFESDLEKTEREMEEDEAWALREKEIYPIGMNEEPPSDGLLSPEQVEKLRRGNPGTLRDPEIYNFSKRGA